MPGRRRKTGRPDALPAAEGAAAPVPSPAAVPDPLGHLREERRMRESGGPEDVAHYTCSCGYAFEASVSTSVACPHCGTGQAW